MPIISGLSTAFLWISRVFGGRFLQALFFMLASLLQPFIGKILALLGLTTVTIVGLKAITQSMTSYLNNTVSDLSSDVLAIMGIMQLDVAFSLIMSAGIIKFTILGLNISTDSLSKSSFKFGKK